MRQDMEKKYEGVTTFQTGEVASRAGVHKETVRYYEKRGLIPEADRRRSGYRIFTRRHIDQIKFIKRSQELGFTLSEIDDLLGLRLDGEASCEQVRSKAQSKLENVERKIRDLERIHQLLGKLIDRCKTGGGSGECVLLDTLEGEADGSR